MSLDFVYAYRQTPELDSQIQTAQLDHTVVNNEHLLYDLDALLAPHLAVVLMPVEVPDYVPLLQAVNFMEVIDGKIYFRVFKVEGYRLDIAPTTHIDLADTKFSDIDQGVSIARTMTSVLLDFFMDAEPQLDYHNVWRMVGNVAVSTFTVEVKKGEVGDKVPFELLGFGKSIGRVTPEEIIQDEELYSELSVEMARRAMDPANTREIVFHPPTVATESLGSDQVEE